MHDMPRPHLDGPPADAVFKALGNPARLTIVRSLLDGERCVCDLVAACGLGWSTTSRHLEVLRGAGVVSSEKRAQKVFYRLELACVANFISCLDGLDRMPDSCCAA
jgi:DNA-binding transcriptional ArsR family regulator